MRKIVKFIAYAIAANLLAAGSLAAQGAPPAQPLQMVIQSHPNAGQRCLDIPYRNFFDGMRLEIYDCNNTPAQTFSYNATSQELTIGGLCVQAWGVGDDADPVGIGACTNQAQQHWKFIASGDYYQITGAKGLCLDIRLAQKNNGTAVQIYRCINGQASQLWAAIQAPQSK
jgi:Ricin-type beta-trefoil lectin domain